MKNEKSLWFTAWTKEGEWEIYRKEIFPRNAESQYGKCVPNDKFPRRAKSLFPFNKFATPIDANIFCPSGKTMQIHPGARWFAVPIYLTLAVALFNEISISEA